MKDFSQLKESLGGILNEAKEKKKLADAERAEKNEADRRSIFESVGKDIGTVIGPYIEKLKENSTMSAQELQRIISDAVKVEVPAIDTAGLEAVIAGAFANFKIPTPHVDVHVPDINIPAPVVDQVKILNWPERMKMLLDGVDLKHPIPVLVVDETGKPFYGGGMYGSGGGGGPRPIADIFDFRGVSLIDSTTNPAAPVLRTSATVSFPSSSISAALVDSSGVQYSGSNPLPVTFSAASSQNVNLFDGQQSLITSHIFNTDFRAIDVFIGGLFGTLAATLVDSSGVGYSGSNPLPTTASLSVPSGQGDAATALRVVIAGNSDSSVSVTAQSVFALNQGDTDARTLRVVQAGDSAGSVFVTGQADSMLTWLARTTNPTAKADGSDVRGMADKLGRPVMRPMQIRDLISTAYVTLSTGTETTLKAAVAGAFLDLIYIMGANTSTAAVQVDIRATTAGNVIASLYIPGNSTAGVALNVPFPQDNQGNNWTVDMGDFTNSNVLISALFSQEI